MKEGVYVFQFGSNQTIRIFYFHQNFEIQVDPNFDLNKTKILTSNMSPTMPSTGIQLHVEYPNFRYCMNDTFQEFKSNMDTMKKYIKCEGFAKQHILAIERNNDNNYESMKHIPCHWEWDPTSKNLTIRVMEGKNVASLEDEFEEREFPNIESNISYISAVTCEMYNNGVGPGKHIKFAIPLNISHVYVPISRTKYPNPRKGYETVWIWIMTILFVAISFAAFCIVCYRRYV